MFEIARLAPDHTLTLPEEIAERFLPDERFIVWYDGDVLHLKPLAPSPLKLVDEAPEGEPMSLAEINDIVHEVRRLRQMERAS